MSADPFIGVVSDTHGYYDPVLDDLFAGAAHIVHAGDVNDPATLARLRRLAPLTAVAGNTDRPDPLDRSAVGGRRPRSPACACSSATSAPA